MRRLFTRESDSSSSEESSSDDKDTKCGRLKGELRSNPQAIDSQQQECCRVCGFLDKSDLQACSVCFAKKAVVAVSLGGASSGRHELKGRRLDNSEFTIAVEECKLKGIAFQLWPAASFLCRYLEAHDEIIIKACRGKPLSEIKSIELGSGVGLSGIFLAALGLGKVILTDLPDVVEHLNESIALNTDLLGDRVTAAPLSWGSNDWSNPMFEGCDLVLAADCVYWEELFEPLVDTLVHLTNSGAIVLMAHVRRWKKDAKFFKLCQKRLTVEKIHEEVGKTSDGLLGEDSCERRIVMRIYRISRQ